MTGPPGDRTDREQALGGSGHPDPAPDLDREAMAAARARWATRAEPPGALGALEALAIHVAGVTGRCPPDPPAAPAVAVFAGDHGVVADGASAWPPEITTAMAGAVVGGGAAINALAAAVGARIAIVDVGLAGPVVPGAQQRRVRAGTASIVVGPAMTREEAAEAVAVGAATAVELVDAGADCLVGGELGIGNTTAAAAIVATVTGLDPAVVTGAGAGAPPGGLDAKVALVRTAVERAGGPEGGVDLLAELGGLEIAALAGFYVAAVGRRVPVVVDGAIALAALCVAERLAPGTAAAVVAGHRSVEPAASAALAHLGLHPLLDLGLRLGEGTGACLAVPLVVAACRALRDMDALP